MILACMMNRHGYTKMIFQLSLQQARSQLTSSFDQLHCQKIQTFKSKTVKQWSQVLVELTTLK